MKKGLIIFLRVIFVVLAMLVGAFFAARAYFNYESEKAIERAAQLDNAPMIGNADNPFTIVEFFDYRCNHCYTFHTLVREAIGDDVTNGTTKILLRPTIIGDMDSVQIAQLVLAADLQKKGETLALHHDIMKLTTIPTYDTIKAMAAARGLNVEQAEKDGETFRQTLINNTNLVRDIGFYGVPALILGDKGYVQSVETMPGINELKLMMIDAKTRLNIPQTGGVK